MTTDLQGWEAVVAYWPRIWAGFEVTVLVSLCAVLLAILMGLLGAWSKLSANKVAGGVGQSYTTLIRGVPSLILMILIYFGVQRLVNNFGDWTGWWTYLEVDHFSAATIAIGFIMGAYMTETFRGAYLSIPRGQVEAAIACGMNRRTIFARIIWPQLVRYALPGFTNNWLVLTKETALAAVLGLDEVVKRSFSAGKATRQEFTFMAICLLLYLVLTAVSEFGLRKVDQRYSRGVRRA